MLIHILDELQIDQVFEDKASLSKRFPLTQLLRPKNVVKYHNGYLCSHFG